LSPPKAAIDEGLANGIVTNSEGEYGAK